MQQWIRKSFQSFCLRSYIRQRCILSPFLIRLEYHHWLQWQKKKTKKKNKYHPVENFKPACRSWLSTTRRHLQENNDNYVCKNDWLKDHCYRGLSGSINNTLSDTSQKNQFNGFMLSSTISSNNTLSYLRINQALQDFSPPGSQNSLEKEPKYTSTTSKCNSHMELSETFYMCFLL